MSDRYTVPMRDAGKTVGMPFLRDPILFEDTVFKGTMGNGDLEEYRIQADSCSQKGGEAQIYNCIRISDGEGLIAKIFYHDAMAVSVNNDKKRKPLMDFLYTHGDYEKYHLMPLLDHGVLNVIDGVYQHYHYVEILPVCKEGDLEYNGKAEYDVLRNTIIPGINTALKTLHSIHIIHRDIKPSNLYWLNGTLVLGDFGTSCYGDEETGGRTVLRRGTLGYTAPEVGYGSAEEKSDYFSFGCTIGTLYLGRHFFQNEINAGDGTAIYARLSKGDIPITYKKEHSSLKNLVVGLLQIPLKDRFDGKMVDKWLEDPDSVEEFTVFITEEGKYSAPFQIGDKKCYTDEEVQEALFQNWELGKTYLYKGFIQNFYRSVNPSLSLLAEKINEQAKAADRMKDYDFGLAVFLHEIRPSKTLHWRGFAFENPGDLLSIFKEDSFLSESDFDAMIDAKYLSWKYERLGYQDTDNLAILKEIEDVFEWYPGMARHLFWYRFCENKDELHFMGAHNADELYDHMVNQGGDFYLKCQSYFFSDQFYAFLSYLKSTEILEVRRRMKPNDLLRNIRLFCVLLEGMVKDRQEWLRTFYFQYGPDSYLYWIATHLDAYDFKTEEANRIREKFEWSRFDASMEIKEMAEEFRKLELNKNQLMENFNNNIFSIYLGLEEGNPSIAANRPDAYFIWDFYGIDVPLGYHKFLNEKQKIGRIHNTMGFRERPPMIRIMESEAKEKVVKTQEGIMKLYSGLTRLEKVFLNNKLDAVLGALFSFLIIAGMVLYYNHNQSMGDYAKNVLPFLSWEPVLAVTVLGVTLYLAASILDYFSQTPKRIELDKRLKELIRCKMFLEDQSESLWNQFNDLNHIELKLEELKLGVKRNEVVSQVREAEATYRKLSKNLMEQSNWIITIAHVLHGVSIGFSLVFLSWHTVETMASMQIWYNEGLRPVIFALYLVLPVYLFYIFRKRFYNKKRFCGIICNLGILSAFPIMLLVLYISEAVVLVFVLFLFIIVGGLLACLNTSKGWRNFGRIFGRRNNRY